MKTKVLAATRRAVAGLCAFTVGQVVAAAADIKINEIAPRSYRAVLSVFPAWTETILPEFLRPLFVIIAVGMADGLVTFGRIDSWSPAKKLTWGSIHLLLGAPALLFLSHRMSLWPIEADTLVYLSAWASLPWLVHFLYGAGKELRTASAAEPCTSPDPRP